MFAKYRKIIDEKDSFLLKNQDLKTVADIILKIYNKKIETKTKINKSFLKVKKYTYLLRCKNILDKILINSYKISKK